MPLLDIQVSKSVHYEDDASEHQRATSYTSWSIHDAELTTGDGEHVVSVMSPVAVGDIVYVVYAVWDTGDSFGRDNGYGFEIISVHTNDKLAYANADSANATRTRSRTRDEDVGYNITYEDGTVVHHSYLPWVGYFERLQSVSVAIARVVA